LETAAVDTNAATNIAAVKIDFFMKFPFA